MTRHDPYRYINGRPLPGYVLGEPWDAPAIPQRICIDLGAVECVADERGVSVQTVLEEHRVGLLRPGDQRWFTKSDVESQSEQEA